MNNGVPGPGGSLGCCAVCGQNFVSDILLEQNVITFRSRDVVGPLAAHIKCANEYLSKPVLEWPTESPLRKAIEEYNAKIQ